MHERASLLDGSLTIDSQSGSGTIVRVYIPRPLTPLPIQEPLDEQADSASDSRIKEYKNI
jgi:hypothetical protein